MESEQLKRQLQASLGANYTIERELGGGGMSRVFLATETPLGRSVVVKVLPPELAHAVSVERFRREIAMSARLQHPHIVPLLTAGETEDLPYYTMPFIDGESLRARLSRVGELPLVDIVRVLRDVAGALAYAHEHGVVHRDIKPENVLFARQHALVADFGVAKALSASTMAEMASSTSLGIALGTPAYMAPEQAAADPTMDGRADLYALGVMAYEMLTGAPPFAGRNAQATLAAHASEMATPVSVRRPTTPPALAALVSRLLEKRPADRPQTAQEVVDALEGVVTTSGTMLPFTASPPKSRMPAWPFAAVAAVLVLVAVGYAARRNRGAAGVGAMAGMIADGEIAPHSVAVLPFANVGKDTATEYFAEGMADELTTALARVPGLKVAARSSAFTFRDQSVGAQSVGKTLHVGDVLEGSVRREGGRLRVTAQLVNTATRPGGLERFVRARDEGRVPGAGRAHPRDHSGAVSDLVERGEGQHGDGETRSRARAARHERSRRVRSVPAGQALLRVGRRTIALEGHRFFPAGDRGGFNVRARARCARDVVRPAPGLRRSARGFRDSARGSTCAPGALARFDPGGRASRARRCARASMALGRRGTGARSQRVARSIESHRAHSGTRSCCWEWETWPRRWVTRRWRRRWTR